MAIAQVQRYRREWRCTFLERRKDYDTETADTTTEPAPDEELNCVGFTKPMVSQENIGDGMGTHIAPHVPGRLSNRDDVSISFGDDYKDLQKFGAYYVFEIEELLVGADGVTSVENTYTVGGYLRQRPSEEWSQDGARRDVVIPLWWEVFKEERNSGVVALDIDVPANKFDSHGTRFMPTFA